MLRIVCFFCFILLAMLLSPIMLCADYSQGFGGKFGVQSDRQDKSAAGWDHIEKVEKHESQKGDYIIVLLRTDMCKASCYYIVYEYCNVKLCI